MKIRINRVWVEVRDVDCKKRSCLVVSKTETFCAGSGAQASGGYSCKVRDTGGCPG